MKLNKEKKKRTLDHLTIGIGVSSGTLKPHACVFFTIVCVVASTLAP